jgi:hypothetical protein
MQAKPEYFIGRHVVATKVKRKNGKKDGFTIFFEGDGELYVGADLQFAVAEGLPGLVLEHITVSQDEAELTFRLPKKDGHREIITCPHGRLLVCDPVYTSGKYAVAYSDDSVTEIPPDPSVERAAESPEWKPRNDPPKKLWDDDNAA